MTFIFWQNVVSIHQSAFIKALAREHDVTLVAAERLDAQRLKERWNIPSMGRARVVVDPSPSEMSRLLSIPGAQHVFSGIDAYPMVYRAFRQAVKRRLPVSVMAEPYEWAGPKGLLRRLKYSLLFLRYGRHIDHLFATGHMGIRCYRRAGFPSRRLHQWGYFTEQKELDVSLPERADRPTMIFIGKIDSRKNILNLVDAAKTLRDRFDRFIIIGTGPYEPLLAEKIYDEPQIQFIGPVPNADIPAYLSAADLLVLPSLFDGWGAVVNEALSVGTRVLCSCACGASILLDGTSRGEAFTQKNKRATIKKWSERGALTRADRETIKSWAASRISGSAAARYFLETISAARPPAPWLQ